MNSSSSNPVRAIIGLGNPGDKYQQTRHNAGFWFVDLVAQGYGGVFKADNRFHGLICRIVVEGQECWLLKPGTFMNRSGQSVSSFCHYYKIPPGEILVAHDELDLAPGVMRLKWGGGHAGHNGLRDIIKALNEREFWRLRVGIGHPGDSGQVVDYVLNRPSRDEGKAIGEVLIDAVRLVPEILTGELQKAMHKLHTGR